MGFKTFIKDLYSVKSTGSILDPSSFQGFDFLSSKVFAGVKVDTKMAISHTAVYACIRDKAETLGQLPVRLIRTKGDKKENVTSGREYKIFTKKPNEYQTMQDFIEHVATSLELYGNFYAYISRNKYGNIAEILPFWRQQSVGVNMDLNGRIYYTYVTNDNKPFMGFNSGQIMHIKLNGLDGFKGLSPISQCARSIGIAISQENHLSNIMESGAMPKGILETDKIFKDEGAIARLKSDWRTKYGGTKNSGETPILENGLKYSALSMTPADSELVEQRQFSRVDVCSIFRVPPHRIGASDGAKKLDVEQENKDYYINRIMPIATKVEWAFEAIMPDGLCVKLDEKGFIRGDFGSLVTAADKAVKAGLVSINEGREIIDYDPADGGEVHAIDTNNLTFGSLTDIPKLQEEARAAALAGVEKPDKPEDKPEDKPSGDDDED